MRRLATPILTCLITLSCITVALQLSAQLRLKGFRYPFYEEQTTNETSRLKGLVTGNRAVSQADALYHVQGMRIELYAADLSTNLIAHAPECFLDQANSSAFSTNTLEISAANNQLHITGRRFRCNLSDNSLVISNDVTTVIDQSLAKSTRDTRNITTTTPFPTPEGSNNAPTNEIRITSNQLLFYSTSNRVIYLGKVKVLSQEMDIACQRLTIQFNTNNSIEHITAEEDVILTSRQGSGSARGERAIYQTIRNQESLTLYGNPARWIDGPREGQAARFVFDLTGKTVRAEENAIIKLPKTSLNQSNWLLSETDDTNGIAKPIAATNDVLQIQSSVVTVHFPTPQQPGRSVFAETNVVISNPSDNTRATSDQASYREDNGTIELIGNAVWESADRVVKGDLLFFDRTNLIFRATSNAYLGLPITALGTTVLPLPDTTRSTNTSISRYLEVFAEKYHYSPGKLSFENEVWMNLFEETHLAGQLSCERLHLTLSPSNKVEQIIAEQDVTLDQFPPPTETTEILEQRLKCENLQVNIATNGRVRKVIARKNVVANKTERKFTDPLPITTTMRADIVTGQFFAHTNAIESVIAQNNVLITQGDRWAQGSKATYWTTNNMIELSGNPIAEAPEGRITDAEVLLWDRNRGRFMVRELRARGNNIPGANNIPLTRPKRK